LVPIRYSDRRVLPRITRSVPAEAPSRAYAGVAVFVVVMERRQNDRRQDDRQQKKTRYAPLQKHFYDRDLRGEDTNFWVFA